MIEGAFGVRSALRSLQSVDSQGPIDGILGLGFGSRIDEVVVRLVRSYGRSIDIKMETQL